MAKRREYKAKLAIEVLCEEITMREIASRENISLNQLGNWKSEFVENSPRASSQSRDEKAAARWIGGMEELEKACQAEAGQPAMENDFLKSVYKKLSGHGRKARAAAKHEELAVKRQWELPGVGRISFYYEPREHTEKERELEGRIKKRIDYWHTRHCWMGAQKLVDKPRSGGIGAPGASWWRGIYKRWAYLRCIRS
ncbi:MAG: hypothetical protein FWG10_13520 [Eubacteriaceae bacterium]|nr:hypothetical protein [Eubacteriaceae bacterium]